MRWRDVKQGKAPSSVQKTKKSEQKPLPPIAPVIERIKAFITDTFMILMPIMYFVFYIIMGSREEFRDNMTSGWLYIFIPHFIIVTLLFFITGQTPGYKWRGLKLLNVDGNAPSLIQIVFRYFFFALSLPFIAGLFIFTMRKDRKNMHDIFSNTYPALHVED